MVDQEPHRSVQLIRRIDSRVPTPLLSASAASLSTSSSTTSLGKLADLRAPAIQMPRPGIGPGRSQTSSPAPSQTAGPRGWTSVVTQQPKANPAQNPIAWMVEDNSSTSASGRVTAAAPARARPATPSASVAPVSGPSGVGEDVPDNWEDDV